MRKHHEKAKDVTVVLGLIVTRTYHHKFPWYISNNPPSRVASQRTTSSSPADQLWWGRQVVPSSTVVVPHTGGLIRDWWDFDGGLMGWFNLWRPYVIMQRLEKCLAAWRLQADFGWICLNSNCRKKTLKCKYAKICATVQDVQALRGISSLN